jgi:hypothetical protein
MAVKNAKEEATFLQTNKATNRNRVCVCVCVCVCERERERDIQRRGGE